MFLNNILVNILFLYISVYKKTFESVKEHIQQKSLKIYTVNACDKFLEIYFL